MPPPAPLSLEALPNTQAQTQIHYGVIYKITNKVNGKIYIGFTLIGLKARWRQHVYNARSNTKSYLYSAMRKHGIEQFSVEIIESMVEESRIHEREIYWIAKLKSSIAKIGYNCTSGGDGARHTESSLAKMRGRKHKPESIEKMRQAQKGKTISPEHAFKLGFWRGKTIPPEIAAKRAVAVKNAWTPEKRAAWAEKMKARYADWTPEMRTAWGQRFTPSDEARRKCSKASKDWWDAHPEAKEKMRERQKNLHKEII